MDQTDNPSHRRMGPMFARGCCGEHGLTSNGITRRRFVQVTGAGALGTVALSGLSWTAIVSEQKDDKFPNQRQPLLVKPILTYEVPQRREKTSWRSWGGIQTEQDAGEEKIRIEEELKAIASGADFPVPPDRKPGNGSMTQSSARRRSR